MWTIGLMDLLQGARRHLEMRVGRGHSQVLGTSVEDGDTIPEPRWSWGEGQWVLEMLGQKCPHDTPGIWALGHSLKMCTAAPFLQKARNSHHMDESEKQDAQ